VYDETKQNDNALKRCRKGTITVLQNVEID